MGVLLALFVSPRVSLGQETPPRPTLTPSDGGVPPRPTLTPTPRPSSLAAPAENWARIVLRAGEKYDGFWTVIQWLDQRGDWQDVSGWQGQVRQGRVRWRVDPKDFRKGPYRWLLLDKPDGALLCVSDAFTLPRDRHDEVIVSLERCRNATPPLGLAPPLGPSIPAARPTETVYVLRVRQGADGTTSITIHNIDTAETRLFTSLENLFRFLNGNLWPPTRENGAAGQK